MSQSEGANLADGREELKRQLAAGEYASSIDVILEGAGRILQKLTRRTEPPAPWISSALAEIDGGMGLIRLP